MQEHNSSDASNAVRALLPGGPVAYCNGQVWRLRSSNPLPDGSGVEHRFHHLCHPEDMEPRHCKIKITIEQERGC